MFIVTDMAQHSSVSFPHALGPEALLRHGKPPFHHLQLYRRKPLRQDWFASTTGLGGRRKFDRALVEGRVGVGEKPHFSQRTREMGHPAAPLASAAVCGKR